MGEIYRSEYGTLYFSENYGNAYDSINYPIGGIKDVGYTTGEFYYRWVHTTAQFKVDINFSKDYGNNFNNYPVDSLIAGITLGGYYPSITRGGASGELYFVSWHMPGLYKIFRSTNYGESFELQYEQPDTCDFYFENYSFTAGRAPGEFYIFKNIPWYNGTNTKLHVYYSSDYAKTFTEYVHVFDKNWTSVNEQLTMSNEQLGNYPNPFTETTTIAYSGNPLKNGVLEIYNIKGQLIESFPMKGSSIVWNSVTNMPGMYFYRIKADNYISKTNTMIIQ